MKYEGRRVETVQDVIILGTLSRADFYSQSTPAQVCNKLTLRIKKKNRLILMGL